jgi:predicted outer membrane repeat protein
MSPRSIRRAHARRIARDQRRALLRRRRELAAGVIGAAAFLAPQAHAASFQVSNTNDSGAGSLRDAITQANTAGTDDEITFAPGLSGLIRLTTGQLSIDAHQGLTITGPGRDVLAISGDANSSNSADPGDSRIFSLTTSSGAGPGVTISGLTLTRGFEPGGGNGGAVINQSGSHLTLDNVAITDSKSNSSGGGIYSVGDLTISHSTLSGNVAATGGALDQSATSYGPGSATISDSQIANNQATSGGGIFSSGKYMTLTNSTVSGNTATNFGGGIASQSKYGLDVKGSTISGNSAETGGGLMLNVDFF